jgi:hypothetical protein
MCCVWTDCFSCCVFSIETVEYGIYSHASLNDGIVMRKSSLCERHRVYLHKPRYYSPLHTQAIWYSPLLLDHKPVQHVTVLNTAGNCNTVVSIIMYYNILILRDHRRIYDPSLTETSLSGA